MDARLLRENALVLDIVQASRGLISAAVRGVAVHYDAGKTVLHFAVSHRDPDVDEDIDDIICEVEALQAGPIDIEAAIHIGFPDAAWRARAGRVVYMSHWRTRQEEPGEGEGADGEGT